MEKSGGSIFLIRRGGEYPTGGAIERDGLEECKFSKKKVLEVWGTGKRRAQTLNLLQEVVRGRWQKDNVMESEP